MTSLQVDETLLEAVIRGTRTGLSMAGVDPPPVGASRLLDARRSVSVIVGVVGTNNGCVTVNMSEDAMLWIASRMLMEQQSEPNDQAIDAVMEIGNLVAGAIKEELAGTCHQAESISVPSVIIGANYSVIYTRGMNTCSVEFELEALPLSLMHNRFFSCTVSLMRRVA